MIIQSRLHEWEGEWDDKARSLAEAAEWNRPQRILESLSTKRPGAVRPGLRPVAQPPCFLTEAQKGQPVSGSKLTHWSGGVCGYVSRRVTAHEAHNIVDGDEFFAILKDFPDDLCKNCIYHFNNA